MPDKIFRGTVMLVTNNKVLRDCLHGALLQAGYGTRVVRSQEEGLDIVQDVNPAIVVVDRRESGFSRLHHGMPLHPPIVTVMYHTEACHEQHCVMDIEDGATRAVCNASPEIIVALLGAVLRRQRWERPISERYVGEEVTVDFRNYEVTVHGMPVQTTSTEFRILKSLVATPGHYLSRAALFHDVWGEGFAVCPHTLDVHIYSLRRKLNPKRSSPDLILTINGSGYKLRPIFSPVETACFQSYVSPSPAISYSSRRPHQPPTHARNGPLVGGSRWRHEPDHRVSARYRIRPAYRGDQGSTEEGKDRGFLTGFD